MLDVKIGRGCHPTNRFRKPLRTRKATAVATSAPTAPVVDTKYRDKLIEMGYIRPATSAA